MTPSAYVNYIIPKKLSTGKGKKSKILFRSGPLKPWEKGVFMKNNPHVVDKFFQTTNSGVLSVKN